MLAGCAAHMRTPKANSGLKWRIPVTTMSFWAPQFFEERTRNDAGRQRAFILDRTMRQRNDIAAHGSGNLLRPAVLWLLLLAVPSAYSYSVLTHEAIIDSTWDGTISPLLIKRFPLSTAEELTQAHAYAYGGCLIQDLGVLSVRGASSSATLTHYVRSGDFVLNLLRDSQNLDEYAFALGALSHYAADNNGHPMAVNRAVPLFYPGAGARSSAGWLPMPMIRFSHAKTEFAFDVFQAAKGRYASAAYKRFIGFQVARPLLERAFENTYGMRLEKVFMNIDLAIGSYRRAIGSVLPRRSLRVAWQIRKQEIRKDAPSTDAKDLPVQPVPPPVTRRNGALPTRDRGSGRKCWHSCSGWCRRPARSGRCRLSS